MSNRYPRYTTERLIVKGNQRPQCKICGELGADTRVDIQVNWMRGDDIVIRVHKQCLKEMPRENRAQKLLELTA